jgi:hypothetical protein
MISILNIALIYISRLYCAFSNKKILNIDKYFVCESRDMSDESGTYIIVFKLKTMLFTIIQTYIPSCVMLLPFKVSTTSWLIIL